MCNVPGTFWKRLGFCGYSNIVKINLIWFSREVLQWCSRNFFSLNLPSCVLKFRECLRNRTEFVNQSRTCPEIPIREMSCVCLSALSMAQSIVILGVQMYTRGHYIPIIHCVALICVHLVWKTANSTLLVSSEFYGLWKNITIVRFMVYHWRKDFICFLIWYRANSSKNIYFTHQFSSL